jgi:NADPH:quinone reductase
VKTSPRAPSRPQAARSALDLSPVLDDNITFHGVLIRDNGDRTRRLAEMLRAGRLHPVVSHVLPLAEAADSHRLVESGHAGGKIVLEVTGPV